MTPKLSWSEKLKRHRKDKAENYAMSIMEPPTKVPRYSALRFPGVVLIMGDIRSGKTGVAHEIANQMHQRRGIPAILHMPIAPLDVRRKVQRMLPSWMTVVDSRAFW